MVLGGGVGRKERTVCVEVYIVVEKLRTDVMGRGHVLGLEHWPLSMTVSLTSVPMMLAWVLCPALSRSLCNCRQASLASLGLCLISKLRRLWRLKN